MIDTRGLRVALAVPALMGGALLLSAGVAVASPQPLTVTLNGANEPAGGQAGSSGSAKVTVDPDSGQVCVTVISSVKNGVAMHIHKAPTGVDGPVVVPFEAKNINAGRVCVAAGASTAKAIAAHPAAYYLNIHTPAKPAGALRGQLRGRRVSQTPTGVNAGSGGQAGTSGRHDRRAGRPHGRRRRGGRERGVAPGPALTVAARPRPASVWLRLSLGAGALLLGAVGLARTGEPPDVGRVPSAQVAPVHRDPPGPGHRPVTGPSDGQPPRRSSPATTSPGRLALPRLGVDAPVQAVGVGPDRLLAVPDDPRTLGWWRGGATPGDAAGSVVVDGHVDSAERGPGALFRPLTGPAGRPGERDRQGRPPHRLHRRGGPALPQDHASGGRGLRAGRPAPAGAGDLRRQPSTPGPGTTRTTWSSTPCRADAPDSTAPPTRGPSCAPDSPGVGPATGRPPGQRARPLSARSPFTWPTRLSRKAAESRRSSPNTSVTPSRPSTTAAASRPGPAASRSRRRQGVVQRERTTAPVLAGGDVGHPRGDAEGWPTRGRRPAASRSRTVPSSRSGSFCEPSMATWVVRCRSAGVGEPVQHPVAVRRDVQSRGLRQGGDDVLFASGCVPRRPARRRRRPRRWCRSRAARPGRPAWSGCR